MTKKPCQRHEAALLRDDRFFPESPGDAAPQGDPDRKGGAAADAGRRGGDGRADGRRFTLEQLACEYAGIVGCDPGPLTLRQLEWMAFARLRTNWDETASILAHVTNTVNGFAGASATVNPADINPYRKEFRAAADKNAPVLSREETIELFKALAGKK